MKTLTYSLFLFLLLSGLAPATNSAESSKAKRHPPTEVGSDTVPMKVGDNFHWKNSRTKGDCVVIVREPNPLTKKSYWVHAGKQTFAQVTKIDDGHYPYDWVCEGSDENIETQPKVIIVGAR